MSAKTKMFDEDAIEGARVTPIDSAFDLQLKIEMFERTVLELGSEVFGMKHTMERIRGSHEQFVGVLKGLKQLLDEKGLITLEDFDAAIDLGEALERFNSQSEHSAYVELEKLKKNNH